VSGFDHFYMFVLSELLLLSRLICEVFECGYGWYITLLISHCFGLYLLFWQTQRTESFGRGEGCNVYV